MMEGNSRGRGRVGRGWLKLIARSARAERGSPSWDRDWRTTDPFKFPTNDDATQQRPRRCHSLPRCRFLTPLARQPLPSAQVTTGSSHAPVTRDAGHQSTFVRCSSVRKLYSDRDTCMYISTPRLSVSLTLSCRLVHARLSSLLPKNN